MSAELSPEWFDQSPLATAQDAEDQELLTRIRDRVVTPRPDCLLWPDAVDRGYGRIWLDGKAQRVHRVVWELVNGPIPDGLTVDHLCRVRYCCNPEHMELVSGLENVQRANRHRKEGRTLTITGVATQAAQRGGPLRDGRTCANGHVRTPENTGVKFDGGVPRLRCLTCKAASDQQYNRRRREARAAKNSGP